MSRRGKKILVSLIIIILLGVIVVGSNIFLGNKSIDRVDISISYGKADTIIMRQDIREGLFNTFGNFLNKRRKNIDEKRIEEYLVRMPYVEKAQVYQTLKGILAIEIKQREPILRIYTLDNREYYVDKLGRIIEILGFETTDAIIANGKISLGSNLLDKGYIDTIQIDNKKGEEKLISNLYYIAQKLINDTLLYYQIDQIHINDRASFELIPKIGNYIIRIGERNDLDQEFRKLTYLYKEGFSRTGWDNYSVVDLRFKNQVVCTRKGNGSGENLSHDSGLEDSVIVNNNKQNKKFN